MTIAVQPDIAGDLRRIHAIITRALSVSIDYCQTPADRVGADAGLPMREAFFTYIEALVGLLHAHHLVEDEVAFPAVRHSIPEMPYDRLAADHVQVAATLGDISRAITDGRAGDSESAKERVGAMLPQLAAIWHPHIAQEELHLTRERIEQIMSPTDHASLSEAISAHSQAHAKPEYLVLPFMLYNLPEEERAVMASHLPPVVTGQLVPVVWAPQWSRMKAFLLD